MAFMCLPAALAQVAVSQAACGTPTVCEEPGAPNPGATRHALKVATEYDQQTQTSVNRLYYTGKVMAEFPPKPHMAVWKLNEHGVEIWRRVRNDPVAGIDAYGVAVDSDVYGNVYAAGVIERAGGKDIIVVAYASDGTLLWERSFDAKNVAGNSLGDDVPVVVKCGSFLYIGGDSESVSPTGASVGSDYVLLELYFPTGVPRYGFDAAGQPVVARYNGTANGNDHLADLVLVALPQGTLAQNGYEAVATGSSPGVGTSTDMTTVLFTGDPAVMAVLRYVPPLNGKEGGTGVTLRTNASSADAIFVTGYSSGQSAGTGNDFLTIAYGTEEPLCSPPCQTWAAVYNNTGSNGADIARDIVYHYDSATGTDRVIVTGESWSATMGYEFATIAYYTSTGAPVWSDPDGVRRFNANGTIGDDLPSDLAVDYEGNLYIAGSSVWGETPDFSVMSYNKLGATRWEEVGTGRVFVTYNGTGSGKDFGAAIGLYNDVSPPRFGVLGTVYSFDAYGIVRYLQTIP